MEQLSLTQKQEFCRRGEVINQNKLTITGFEKEVIELKRQLGDKEAEVKMAEARWKEALEKFNELYDSFASPELIEYRFELVIKELDAIYRHIRQFKWNKGLLTQAEKVFVEIDKKMKDILERARENAIKDTHVSKKPRLAVVVR